MNWYDILLIDIFRNNSVVVDGERVNYVSRRLKRHIHIFEYDPMDNNRAKRAVEGLKTVYQRNGMVKWY